MGEENVEMKRVCAWCQKPLNSEPDGGSPVSHGICDRCFENTLTKISLLTSLRNAIKFSVEGDGEGNRGSQPRNPRFQ